MKTSSLITVLLLLLVLRINAQQSTQSPRPFKIWAKVYSEEYNKDLTLSGYLYESKDSSIIISKYNLLKDNRFGEKGLTTIYINNLDVCATRKSGNKAVGIVLGTCTGLIIGLIRHQDEFDPIVPISTLAGFGVGISIGSIKKIIPIHRKYERYDIYKSELKRKSIKEIQQMRYGVSTKPKK